MENIIKSSYSISFQSYRHEKEIYILTDEHHTYYFVPYLRPMDDLKDLYYVTEELLKRNIATHTFIINNNNQIITKVAEKDYVLLKINYLEGIEFNLSDINNFNKITNLNAEKGKLYRNNWADLWSSKVDYFEYQIRELGKNKKIILNSFSYFIGLAENAIAYANNAKEIPGNENKKIVLSHRRINYPNYSINYLNPISYIFDLHIRDIAEYIKSMFFSGEDIWKELDNYFKYEELSPYDAHMLYARLLYPSYYFDIYENVMNRSSDEEDLIPIIDKINEYEEFLNDMFHYLNAFVKIEPIEWLIKKDPIGDH